MRSLTHPPPPPRLGPGVPIVAGSMEEVREHVCAISGVIPGAGAGYLGEKFNPGIRGGGGGGGAV